MVPVIRLLCLVTLLHGALAFAEAGIPAQFCGTATCTCGSVTCTCGQTCDLNSGQCFAAQAGFCSQDSQCAAVCGSFICEGNYCRSGSRDGGAGGGSGTGGGTAGAGGGSGGSGTGGGGGCSCDVAGAWPLALATVALSGRLRRRAATRAARR